MDTKFGELSDKERAELFIAWYNGKKIQYKRHLDNHWLDLDVNPRWVKEHFYRAKKEPANSIDWSLITTKYNYLAMDRDKQWYLYEKRPVLDMREWNSHSLKCIKLNLEPLSFFNPNPVDWEESLIIRPNST